MCLSIAQKKRKMTSQKEVILLSLCLKSTHTCSNFIRIAGTHPGFIFRKKCTWATFGFYIARLYTWPERSIKPRLSVLYTHPAALSFNSLHKSQITPHHRKVDGFAS